MRLDDASYPSMCQSIFAMLRCFSVSMVSHVISHLAWHGLLLSISLQASIILGNTRAGKNGRFRPRNRSSVDFERQVMPVSGGVSMGRGTFVMRVFPMQFGPVARKDQRIEGQ